MERLSEMTMLDEFSSRGQWWLPGKEDDAVPGEIQFSPDDIRLKLDRPFPEMAERFFGGGTGLGIFDADVIVGTTLTGEDCTLRSSFVSHLGADCEFVVNELLIGVHFDNAATISAASASYSHLEEWADTNWFQVAVDLIDKRETVSFSREPHELLRVANASPLIETLQLALFLTQRRDHRHIHIESMSRLRLEFSKPIPLSDAHHSLRLFQNFLSLCAGEAVRVQKLVFSVSSSTTESLETFNLFYRTRQLKQRTIYRHEMPLPLHEIESVAPDIIRRWFSEETSLRPVYNLLLSTMQNPDQYPESIYLALTQALESFHRVVDGGTYVGEEFYDRIRTALSAAIPGDTPDELKVKLAATLKFANEFSFRKRLKDLLGKLGPMLSERLLGAERQSDFIKKVVDLRNYLTHRDETSVPGIADVANKRMAVYNLNQKLRATMIALLFLHLGLPEQKLLQLFDTRHLHLAH